MQNSHRSFWSGPIRFEGEREIIEYRARHCLRVRSYGNTPSVSLCKNLLLWKLVTVHHGQLTEDSMLLTRSLAFTLVESTGTSLSLGVMVAPLGRGFLIPTSMATSSKGVIGPLRPWLDLISRPSILVGVAMTLTARRVAKEEKILACILNKEGAGDGNRLSWKSKWMIDVREASDQEARWEREKDGFILKIWTAKR